MLRFAEYTIDRVVRLDEQEDQAKLELACGIECTLLKRDTKSENLLRCVKGLSGLNAPLALRIADGVLVDVAFHRYTFVLAHSREGERPVEVCVGGESGTLRITRPELAEECYPLLVRSRATGGNLLFIWAYDIEVVVELPPDEIDNFNEMWSYPSPLELPLAHLLPVV